MAVTTPPRHHAAPSSRVPAKNPLARERPRLGSMEVRPRLGSHRVHDLGRLVRLRFVPRLPPARRRIAFPPILAHCNLLHRHMLARRTALHPAHHLWPLLDLSVAHQVFHLHLRHRLLPLAAHRQLCNSVALLIVFQDFCSVSLGGICSPRSFSGCQTGGTSDVGSLRALIFAGSASVASSGLSSSRNCSRTSAFDGRSEHGP